MAHSAFYSLEGPLDSMPSERQMRTANFGGLTGLIRKLGADPRAVLERHGVDPQAIRDPDSYVACKSLVDVLEYCSVLFKDPLFGLHLAQQQGPDVFGCVTALCRAAPTFRDAVNSFIDYIPLVHSPVVVLELAEGRETAELRWRPRSDLGSNGQANYQAASLDLSLLRSIGGPEFRASYVNLASDVRARDVSEIENRLGCRFNGRAATNAVAFPVHLLDRPVASSNRLLFRLLGGYLNRVKSASRTTVVERVEDYVRGALPAGNCSIENCAKKLGTSIRTLQANLGEHGLKFSDLLEKQRIDLARTYLGQGQLRLDEVAAMLGYSEQSSFGRAFKRWTGSTPQLFRSAGTGEPGHAPAGS